MTHQWRFLNAISRQTAKKASFSSLTIPEKCGNLYLPGKHQLDLQSVDAGTQTVTYKTSHDLMQEADWIFLASNWTKEIKFLDESIENLNAELVNFG